VTESYPIKIWSGLLKDGHTQRIENALWEFIWLINKVTKEEKGIGMVLKGKPIKVVELSKDLKRSYSTILRHLKQLEKHGYINLKRCPYGFVVTINNSKKFATRYSNNDISGYGKNDISEKPDIAKLEARHSNNDKSRYSKSDINKEDTKHIYKTDKEEDMYCRDEKIPFSEIIEYLNLKAEKNYRPNITKTQDLIRARGNNGFKLKDFKKVIDIKTEQWKDDPAMNKFLRPETLFGNKFEGYLNEKVMAEMRKDGRAKKHFENERDYTDEEQQRIDTKFFGKKD